MTAQQAVSTQASGRAATGSSGRVIAGRSDPAGAFVSAVNPIPPHAVPYRTGSGWPVLAPGEDGGDVGRGHTVQV